MGGHGTGVVDHENLDYEGVENILIFFYPLITNQGMFFIDRLSCQSFDLMLSWWLSEFIVEDLW